VRVATRGFTAFELASLLLRAAARSVRNMKQGGSLVVIPRDIHQRQTPSLERAAAARARRRRCGHLGHLGTRAIATGDD
jgi:hypothetical protein